MTHSCHDPDCDHDPALEAATAVILGHPSSSVDSFDDRLRKAVSELVQERLESHE